MAQELSSISKKVAIIGGGPAGCICAYFLQRDLDVTIFDFGKPLRTLLPTGGGRCNLAHAEYDFKELAKNYLRGEKFLYSIFSKFSTAETIDLFEKIGIKTYTQDDYRIFPISNSSSDVREKILKSLNRVKFKNEKITKLDFANYDYIVIATGGHASYSLIEDHTIIPPKPSLVGLRSTELFPQGVVIKGVNSEGYVDDILFTHEGISGPLVYKISSKFARREFPYKLVLNFYPELDLQTLLNNNPHKSIKNLLSELLPKSFAVDILTKLDIDAEQKCHKIEGKTRDKIIDKITNCQLTISGTSKGGEVVTCGGISLDEINAKTMESKLKPNLFFCGEVIDIDGFCGGFNLQNCWSTAYVAAQGILKKAHT